MRLRVRGTRGAKFRPSEEGDEQAMNLCHPDCYPLCDFCQYFQQDGREYGQCVHPEHPQRRALWEHCDDFFCATRKDADPELVRLHLEAIGKAV